MSPIFRLSFRVELARPSDDPETIDGGIPLEQSQDQNARRTLKQSIRQHPRFSLRITALIALSLGIILNAVIYSIYGRRYYTVRQLTGVAEVVVSPYLLFFRSSIIHDLSHPSLLLKRGPS